MIYSMFVNPHMPGDDLNTTSGLMSEPGYIFLVCILVIEAIKIKF